MRKLKSYFNVFLSLSILMIFSHCQKNVDTEVDFVVDFHINKLNPYDEVGNFHNKALDFFIDNQKSTTDISIDEIFKSAYDFSKDAGFSVNDLEKVSDEKFINLWTTYGKADNKNEFLLSNGYVSKQGYDFLLSVDKVFDGSFQGNEQESIEQLKNLERKLINNEIVLSQREKDVMLCGLAVGRYSLIYWSKQLSSEKSKWVRQAISNTRTEGSNGDIAKEDFKGAVSGGLAGAIIGGTATLGTLTVPAWVAGAVVGGAVGSTVEALTQLFDWDW